MKRGLVCVVRCLLAARPSPGSGFLFLALNLLTDLTGNIGEALLERDAFWCAKIRRNEMKFLKSNLAYGQVDHPPAFVLPAFAILGLALCGRFQAMTLLHNGRCVSGCVSGLVGWVGAASAPTPVDLKTRKVTT